MAAVDTGSLMPTVVAGPIPPGSRAWRRAYPLEQDRESGSVEKQDLREVPPFVGEEHEVAGERVEAEVLDDGGEPVVALPHVDGIDGDVDPRSRVENAAWSYEDPVGDMAEIRGHLAFYANDAVTVERI